MSRWWETAAIDEAPETFLRRHGEIFAVFDGRTQDSDNVSFGVEIDRQRYFVKTAGAPNDEAHLPHRDRVGLLRNAAEIGVTRHRCLPDMVTTIDSPHGLVLVYEWRLGELLHSAPSLARFRALPPEAISTCLDDVFEVHLLLNRVAVDFYFGSLMYEPETRRVHLIDLDHYVTEPFRNDMGRMFGSSRFMAPEEHTLGALIDQSTTVHTLGRLILLTLGDGTSRRESFRGTEAQWRIATRATATPRADRYPSIAEFHRAWRAARA